MNTLLSELPANREITMNGWEVLNLLSPACPYDIRCTGSGVWTIEYKPGQLTNAGRQLIDTSPLVYPLTHWYEPINLAGWWALDFCIVLPQ